MLKNPRRYYLLRNRDSIFEKIKKNLTKINCWFRHYCYPLNCSEIKMLNQVFENWGGVNINDIIRIQGEDYFITNTKYFKFSCFLTANNPWAWNIEIEYRGKNKKTAIIHVSSDPAPLMGYGFYTIFDKENNKWINKGTGHWIS